MRFKLCKTIEGGTVLKRQQHTPASLIRVNAIKTRFDDLPLGATFELNGCVWSKRSSRTGSGIWPACLPDFSYFKKNEIVNSEQH